MRIHFTSPDRPKAVARRLKKALVEHGITISHTESLDLAARLYGYRDWQELSAITGTLPPSPDDADCSPDVVHARQDFQVAVLRGSGLPAEAAFNLVMGVHPTRVRRARTRGELVSAVVDIAKAKGADEVNFLYQDIENLIGTMELRGDTFWEEPWDAALAGELLKALVPNPHEMHPASVGSAEMGGRDDVTSVRVQWYAGANSLIMRILRTRKGAEEWAASPARPAPPPRVMPPSVPYTDIVRAVEGFGRNAWFPKLTVGDAGGPTASRFYGDPWLPSKFRWPKAFNGSPMTFILQINVEDLPPEARKLAGGKGLISLFYDTEGFPDEYGSDKGDKLATLLRFDPATQPGAVRTHPETEEASRRPQVGIIHWVHGIDYPHREDLTGEEDGVGLLPPEMADWYGELGDAVPGGTAFRYHGTEDRDRGGDVNWILKVTAELYGDGGCDKALAEHAQSLCTYSGNKIGGWPAWSQAPEWPKRRKRRLSHLFQLATVQKGADGRFFSLGDPDMNRHIFIDPEDPSVLVLI